MRLISRFELASRPTPALQAMLDDAFSALFRSSRGTPARTVALANIENIRAELSVRL